MDFVFRHKEQDAFMLNLDGQFSLPIDTGKLNVYGIAGIGFSSWNVKELDEDGDWDMRRTEVSASTSVPGWDIM